MGKIIKFLKHNIYFIGGLLYLAGVLVGFGLTLSFVARTINASLPGGSEVSVPPVVFNVDEYRKIQNIVGVILEEESTEEPQVEIRQESLDEEIVIAVATTTESEIAETAATSTETVAE